METFMEPYFKTVVWFSYFFFTPVMIHADGHHHDPYNHLHYLNLDDPVRFNPYQDDQLKKKRKQESWLGSFSNLYSEESKPNL